MKRYLFTSMLVLVLSAVLAQPTKKSAVKDKPPTQKEMEDMMKEMKAAMDEMSPEDKKMIDSLGIKMPSINNIPKVSDKQLAEAWENETLLVPKKNPAKIAAILPAPTKAALPAFISKVHAAVVAKLTAEGKANAESIYQSIKQKPGISTANAAISIWIKGSPLLATYLMGKACQENPADIDNINNYAAMLTMTGAEQAAIPFLQNLNKQFPKNSTVLNNLGQAWFGLGDIDKASRYLDSAILIYAYHPQANYTKCLVEESKGNTTKAAEALIRSIKKSHSVEKENKLRKLGKELSGKDIDFPFPMPQDPLGLEKFTWPGYPMSVAECETLEKSWDVFKQACNAELQQLNSKSAQLEKIATEAIEKRMKAIIAASNSGKSFNPIPWYAARAILKMNYLTNDKDGSGERRFAKDVQAVADKLLQDEKWQETRIEAEKLLSEKYDPLIGEGRPNPLHEYCNAVNKVRDQYLKQANTLFQATQKELIEGQRKWLNNQVYYAQYINWPEEFELIKIQARIKWLNIIKGQVVRFLPKGPFCEDTVSKNPSQTKLQAFDDVACKYHSSADIGLIEFNNDCSRFEAKFKTGIVDYTRKIDSDDHDRLISASLEITAGASKGWEKGPVQAEVKAEIKGKLEWNDREVTNWEVSSEVGASAGSNLGHADKSIDIAGVKAQVGMNSGSSLTGKGLLQGISIENK